jgi:uncharacterized protein
LSGILTVLIPEDFFAGWAGHQFLSYLVVMAVGIPLYICSTGSIPIALSLLHLGFSPGAALVFLITGPATNAATFTTLSTFLSRRCTFIYLGVLAATSLGGGMLFDLLATPRLPEMMEHAHGEHLKAWHYLSGFVILSMIACANWPKFTRAVPVQG